jgi:hypothetical protein
LNLHLDRAVEVGLTDDDIKLAREMGALRDSLWPDAAENVWHRKGTTKGFTTIPRVIPPKPASFSRLCVAIMVRTATAWSRSPPRTATVSIGLALGCTAIAAPIAFRRSVTLAWTTAKSLVDAVA